MKLGDTYTVLFNSFAKNALILVNSAYITYEVNWKSILPEKYKNFQCKVSFKSDSLDANQFNNLIETGYVTMDFAKTNVYDGNNVNSNVVAFFFPREYVPTTVCYTNADFTDLQFTIQYPTSNIITIRHKEIDNDKYLDDMPNYLLVMTLQGIEE